jgi:hypothetical protein
VTHGRHVVDRPDQYADVCGVGTGDQVRRRGESLGADAVVGDRERRRQPVGDDAERAGGYLRGGLLDRAERRPVETLDDHAPPAEGREDVPDAERVGVLDLGHDPDPPRVRPPEPVHQIGEAADGLSGTPHARQLRRGQRAHRGAGAG